jgi:hypothetical protein
VSLSNVYVASEALKLDRCYIHFRKYTTYFSFPHRRLPAPNPLSSSTCQHPLLLQSGVLVFAIHPKLFQVGTFSGSHYQLPGVALHFHVALNGL